MPWGAREPEDDSQDQVDGNCSMVNDWVLALSSLKLFNVF
jgi:hypothetical protein